MKIQNVMGGAVAAALILIACAIVKFEIQSFATHATNGRVHVTTLKAVRTLAEPAVEQVVKIDQQALDCMTTNLYFEARNQDTDEAMAAVGYTVLNRVNANTRQYPDSICEVVYQGRRNASGNYIRNNCQFSWVCDGKADVPNMRHPVEAAAWQRAQRVAREVILGTIDNPVGNATMYHATYVRPYWVRSFERVVQIEDHIFYQKA